LIFLVTAGTFPIESLLNVGWLFLFWVVTAALTLVGSMLPAAAMVCTSQRFGLQSPAFFIGTSSIGSCLLAGMAAGLLWSPDIPPADPDYLTFHDLLLRIAGLFVPGGFVGGITYWIVAFAAAPRDAR
jgi:hypothetical protein